MERKSKQCSSLEDFATKLRNYYDNNFDKGYFGDPKLTFDNALENNEYWDTELVDRNTFFIKWHDIKFTIKNMEVTCQFGGGWSNIPDFYITCRLSDFPFQDSVLHKKLRKPIRSIGKQRIWASAYMYEGVAMEHAYDSRYSITVEKEPDFPVNNFEDDNIIKGKKVGRIDYSYQYFANLDLKKRYQIRGTEKSMSAVYFYYTHKKDVINYPIGGFVLDIKNGDCPDHHMDGADLEGYVYDFDDCYIVDCFPE